MSRAWKPERLSDAESGAAPIALPLATNGSIA
jgi:hypothetical protein